MEQKQKEIKVAICVPSSDAGGMNVLTAQCIGAAIIESEGLVQDIIVRRSCDIVSNRTWLLQEAIRKGMTHVLFVDCDMLFPSGAIKQMLAHDKEIVAVEYPARTFPLKKTFEPLTEESATELYKAKFAGMGLMLIDLSILQDPKFGIDADGKKSPWLSFGRDSNGALAMGEDAWFCFVARDSGYDTWIDPTILMYHLGEYGYCLPTKK
ncbi:MAG: hypothetical protein KBD16_00600 [Candidatus Pacebacteria bacterium]|nr:hypothetical protein [Candidatus Paceibacterota bacterium]